MKRNETRKVIVKNVEIGGSNSVKIQSMCDIKTSDVNSVVRQIKRCEKLGADLMRVSVLDKDDAYAIKEITKKINIPLVADIHYSYELALLAIENGASKIRINPGNLKSENEIKQIIELAKAHKVAIRIGLNEGSIGSYSNDLSPADNLVNQALKTIELFEQNGFYDIVVSLKSTDVETTIEAYRKFSKISSYPLHIGLTESGYDEIGIIRSVSALSILLHEGIGDTIRISLTHNPEKEIKTCKRLLHDLGLYPNYPTIISCPTCGRCEVNIAPLAKKVMKYLEDNNIYLKVAIMGCPVNGVGEGKNADLGLAGGKNKFVLFKKGEIIKTIDEKDAYNELIKEIDLMKN